MARILNALASPVDPRDLIHVPTAAALSAALASRVVKTGMGPPLDQDGLPQCTTYAAVGLRQWHEKRDNHGVVPFDPGVLYGLVKGLEDREDGVFDGAFLRDVLRIMKGSGTPLADGRRAGKIATYWRVADGTEAWRRALADPTLPPLYTRLDWDAAWMGLPLNRIMKPPVGRIVGGHAFLVFGYDDNVAGGSFLIRNSWGRWSTAGSGNAYLPYWYLANRDPEAWIAVDVKGD